MVPSAAPDGVDGQGRCVHHPFVQLRRLSHRTGEWKALLDSCPLCVMDDKSVASSYGGSVCASVFSSGAEDDPPACSPCAPAPEEQGRSGSGRGRSLTRPLASSASLEDQLVSLTSTPRSTSRVRFSDGESDLEDSGREGDNIFLGRQTSSSSLPAGMAGDQSPSGLSCNGGVIKVNGGMCSGSGVASGSSQQLTKGVLKALPKYRTCKAKMQRQASEIEKVTTMSMDLSIDCNLNFDANHDHSDEEELDYDEDEAELSYDEVEVDYADQDDEDDTFAAEEKKEEFKPQKIGRSKVNRRLEQMQLPDLYQLAQDEEEDDAAASEEDSKAESQQNHNKMTTIKSHGSSSSRGGTQQLSSRTNSSGSNSRRPGSTKRSSSRKNDLYKMAQDREEYASASEEESEMASGQVEQKKMTGKSRGSTKQLRSRTNSSGSSNRTDHASSSSRRHRSSERGSSSRNSERAGKDKNSKEQSKRRSTSLQTQDIVRPDPEEFPCNTGRSSRSPGSVSRGSHGHQQRPSSRRQAKRSSSFGSAEQRYGNIPMPPPPPPPQQSPGQQFNVSNMNVASMQMLQPTIRQPCHTSMVVNPSPNYDDEVSTLSFMGGSVGTGTIASRELSFNDSTNNQEPKSKQFFGKDTSPSDDASDYEDAVRPQPLLANSMINTNDYDTKGRCLHHQHVRLRKKKMFGRGWKVLMSACPDCCVDELKRIRAVEENNRRRTNERRERSDRSDMSSCGGSGGGGMDGSHRSGNDIEAGRRSSARSVSSNCSDSQHDQEQRLRSSVRSVSSSHGGSFATTKMSGAVPPSPPPRTQKRSPNQDSFGPPSRSPSQESRLSDRAPPTAAQITMKCPSQDSFRVASVSLTTAHRARRSPSKGGFNAGVDKGSRSSSRQSSDDATASMTSDEQDCSNLSNAAPPMTNLEQVELSLHRNQGTGSKKRSSSRSKSRAQRDLSRSPSQSQPQPQGQQRGTIHVRQMQWTDADGQAGTYTGQVDDRFVPHGHGTVEYASGWSREGEWKNGRFLNKSKGGRSGGAGKSGSGDGSDGNGRSRSESREEGGSRSGSRGATGRRSSSRSRQQPSMPAAT